MGLRFLFCDIFVTRAFHNEKTVPFNQILFKWRETRRSLWSLSRHTHLPSSATGGGRLTFESSKCQIKKDTPVGTPIHFGGERGIRSAPFGRYHAILACLHPPQAAAGSRSNPPYAKIKWMHLSVHPFILAEREGFEPSVRFPAHTISSRAP